jgi:hypothetical protein
VQCACTVNKGGTAVIPSFLFGRAFCLIWTKFVIMEAGVN